MSIEVILQPEGLRVNVLPGTTVQEAAAVAGIIIDAPCGGKGNCGKCRVEIIKGHMPPTGIEQKFIGREDLNRGTRLACQARIFKPAQILIPPESRFSVQRILTDTIGLQGLEPGSGKQGEGYGVAFDIGTTTLVGTLLETGTGKETGVSARMNPQTVYGDDVISRINMVIVEADGLEKLHGKLIAELNIMIDELVKNAGINRELVRKVTVAGNSTMQHLFLNVSPESMGTLPFTLAVRDSVSVGASETGIKISKEGTVRTLPNIAGYVGGDTVAGILATGLHKSDRIKLFIDIGTNGEIVLGNKDRFLAASTAAGPAFEGARISQGMRATSGAIEKVVIKDDVEINVIGNAEPAGICGTGLIDTIAELLRLGIIDATGRVLGQDEVPSGIPDKVKSRINSQGGFILVPAGITRNKRPVGIIRRDVREVQVGKAAIAAGVRILKQKLGIKDGDIHEVLLAGAFGNYIRRNNARRIGLIPDLPSERIRYVGNTASAGAKLVLLSGKMAEEADAISKNAEYVELSTVPDFNDLFAEEIQFQGE